MPGKATSSVVSQQLHGPHSCTAHACCFLDHAATWIVVGHGTPLLIRSLLASPCSSSLTFLLIGSTSMQHSSASLGTRFSAALFYNILVNAFNDQFSESHHVPSMYTAESIPLNTRMCSAPASQRLPCWQEQQLPARGIEQALAPAAAPSGRLQAAGECSATRTQHTTRRHGF